MSLQKQIQELAVEFSNAVLKCFRGASIDELTNGGAVASKKAPAAKRSGGRLPRRSDEEIQTMVDAIVACVSKHPEGIRAEELRTELKVDKKELMKPVIAALESGVLRKEGEKRATTYFVGKKSAAKTEKPKAEKKASTKKAAAKKSSRSAKKDAKKAKVKLNGSAGPSKPAEVVEEEIPPVAAD